MKADRWIIVSALLLAAVYFYAIEQIPVLQIGDPMGAKAVPRLLGVLLVVSAVLLWFENRVGARDDGAREPPVAADQQVDEAAPVGRKHLWVVASVVAWTALYFEFFEVLGYAIATSVYLLALTAYFNPGRWPANASTALLFSFASYLAFTRIFGAQLAAGVLPF